MYRGSFLLFITIVQRLETLVPRLGVKLTGAPYARRVQVRDFSLEMCSRYV